MGSCSRLLLAKLYIFIYNKGKKAYLFVKKDRKNHLTTLLEQYTKKIVVTCRRKTTRASITNKNFCVKKNQKQGCYL